MIGWKRPKGLQLMQRRVAFLLFVSCLVNGCGSSTSEPASSGSLSGNWEMILTKSNNPVLNKTQSGSLVQKGDAVTGSVIFTDIPCSGIGSVSGTVSGANISMLVSPTGVSVNLTGTIAAGQTSMSGNYNILSTGCAGSQSAPVSGTWTANLVSPLNGNITGTITSSGQGGTHSVTGKISQGANAGASSTPLSGSLSATGYCFSSATIMGSISGTSAVLDLVDTDGTQIGEITGSTSLDGTSMTGTYHIVPQGVGGTPPCVDGDNGSVSLTL
jgi:hypothetical protein